MRVVILILWLLTLPVAAAYAQGCRADTIRDSSGQSLSMSSGQVFQVYPGGDTVRAQSWEPLDKVSICPLGGAAYSITDLDRNGAQVKGLYQG